MTKNYATLLISFLFTLFSSLSAFAQPLAEANDDIVSVATADIQTAIADVLANDSLYGVPANLSNVLLTPLTSSTPGIQLNTDGSVSITQAGLAVGSYTLTYQICDILYSNVCDIGTITVFIGICAVPAPIVAENAYIYCNSIAPITISNLPATSTWTVSIEKDGVFLTTLSGVGTTTTSFFISSPGVYTFSIINDGNGCMSPQVQLIAIAQNCGLNLFYTGNYFDFNGNNLIDVGDTINYTFSVFNNGNTSVSNIGVTSPNINISGAELPIIAPNASANNSFSGIHVITQNEIDAQEVTTVATATGMMNGQVVNSTRTYTKFVGIVSGIRLSAFIDTNANGIQDFGEVHCPLGKFNYEKNNSGNVITLFNNNNNVIYENNPINSYDISFTIDGVYAAYYTVALGGYNNITVPSGSGFTHYRFPVIALPYNDLAVNVYSNSFAPRPGFTYSNTVILRNMSYQNVASGTISFTKDSALNIIQTTPSTTTPTANGFDYNFTNLGPFQTQTINVEMLVPTIPTVALGQQVTSSVTAISAFSEIDNANNSDAQSSVIVGSYDPNDKVEHHGGKILHSSFASNDYLTYTIRFENTGTAPALNVRVTDALELKVDESTFRMVDASHDYVLTQIGNNLTWKFDAINLPPSVANTNIGHGYIIFQVKPKAGFAIGDIINNTADIFFDFNPAIVTNTTETEFVAALGVDAFDTSNFALYPNPTSNLVNIVMKSGTIETVSVIDILGKTVLSKVVNTNVTQMDLSELSAGIYLVKVGAAGQQQTFKIAKQ